VLALVYLGLAVVCIVLAIIAICKRPPSTEGLRLYYCNDCGFKEEIQPWKDPVVVCESCGSKNLKFRRLSYFVTGSGTVTVNGEALLFTLEKMLDQEKLRKLRE